MSIVKDTAMFAAGPPCVASKAHGGSVMIDLRSMIPNPCYGRPFVCDGFPQSSKVMVVGENPATDMSANWWSWWNDETGFNLSVFEHDYEARRRAMGKSPVSSTRRRLRRLRTNGLRCLETNAFANEREGGHGTGVPNGELIQQFIRHLPELRAIIAHGAEAQQLMQGVIVPSPIRQWSMPHFIKVGYDRIDAVSGEIKNWIEL
jgi:hypothetical protein